MNKFYFNIFFLILIYSNCFCQITPPALLLSGNTRDIFLRDILVDKSGNQILLGEFESDSLFINDTLQFINKGNKNSFGGNYKDAFLIKYSIDGNVYYKKHLWSTGRKSLEGYDKADVYRLALDNFGNLYISGKFPGDTLHFGDDLIFGQSLPNMMLFIVKLDSTGNLLWEKSLPMDDYGNGSIDIITSENNDNFIITGTYTGNITIDTFNLLCYNYTAEDENIFIARLSSSGKTLWAKCFGGNDYDNIGDLIPDKMGGYYITGIFYSNKLILGSDTLLGKGNVFLAKMDSNGKFYWAIQSTGTGQVYVSKSNLDNEGNIYVLGGFDYSLKFGSYTLNSIFSNDFNLFLVKFNSNGEPLWANSAIGSSRDFLIDKFNNMIIAGTSLCDSFILGNYKFNNIKNGDIFIAKFLSDGKVNEGTFFTSGSPRFIRKDPTSNNLYICGAFYINQLKIEDNIFYNNHKDINHYNIFVAPITSIKLGINNQYDQYSHFTVNAFPVPGDGKFSFVVTSYNISEYTISIYDIYGKTVYQKTYTNLTGNKNLLQIDLSENQSGIYFYKVSNILGFKSGKLIIER
jgi:hypothetical protein